MALLKDRKASKNAGAKVNPSVEQEEQGIELQQMVYEGGEEERLSLINGENADAEDPQG